MVTSARLLIKWKNFWGWSSKYFCIVSYQKSIVNVPEEKVTVSSKYIFSYLNSPPNKKKNNFYEVLFSYISQAEKKCARCSSIVISAEQYMITLPDICFRKCTNLQIGNHDFSYISKKNIYSKLFRFQKIGSRNFFSWIIYYWQKLLKTPVRPRADFFKPSKSMKRDAKQSSPGTVIDITNLSSEDEEINDDSYLE